MAVARGWGRGERRVSVSWGQCQFRMTKVFWRWVLVMIA